MSFSEFERRAILSLEFHAVATEITEISCFLPLKAVGDRPSGKAAALP